MRLSFLLYLLKSYISDLRRLEGSEERIEKYREKQFRRILKLVMKTPMYREKYKGIDVSKITLQNIDELPILTKADIRKHFPDGVVPENFDRRKGYVVSTSGSTGQPTSIYTDFYTIVRALMGFIREIREYDISWRKDRMTVIADLTPGSAEEAYLNQTAIPNLRPFFSMNNMQLLHVGENVEKMIEKIDAFNPKFIGGYPGVLRALAVLKKKGYGKNIEPEYIASSGAVLDDYTRKYIEEAFNTKVFDVYGSTEGGPIAFECRKGNYHIHYDMVHLEFLDEDMKPVKYGEPGRIIVTKLYGTATPIIRYDGLNDFVIPLANKCNCGINSPLIEKIGGRKADSIVLPSGQIIPPSSITGIPAKVMEKMGTRKILQFQIIQKSENEVDVLVVIDEDLRNVGPDVDSIFRELKKKFEERFNGELNVEIKEVEKIEKPEHLDTPPPVVTSMVRVG